MRCVFAAKSKGGDESAPCAQQFVRAGAFSWIDEALRANCATEHLATSCVCAALLLTNANKDAAHWELAVRMGAADWVARVLGAHAASEDAAHAALLCLRGGCGELRQQRGRQIRWIGAGNRRRNPRARWQQR